MSPTHQTVTLCRTQMALLTRDWVHVRLVTGDESHRGDCISLADNTRMAFRGDASAGAGKQAGMGYREDSPPTRRHEAPPPTVSRLRSRDHPHLDGSTSMLA